MIWIGLTIGLAVGFALGFVWASQHSGEITARALQKILDEQGYRIDDGRIVRKESA